MSRTRKHVPAWVQALRDKRVSNTVVFPENVPDKFKDMLEDKPKYFAKGMTAEEVYRWRMNMTHNRTNGDTEWMVTEYDTHFHRGKTYGEDIEYIKHPKRVLATNKFRAAAKRMWRAEIDESLEED